MHDDRTRRVVVKIVRRLALLQWKTLIETKNRTLEMLKMELFDCAINEKCCSVDGGRGVCHFFFVLTPGDLTAQKSPPPGICHSM